MTTCRLVSGDALLPVTRKSSAVVEVEQLGELSPATEEALLSFGDVMSGAYGLVDSVRGANSKGPVLRPECTKSWSEQWAPDKSNMEISQRSLVRSLSDVLGEDTRRSLERRNVQMRLPPFEQFGISARDLIDIGVDRSMAGRMPVSAPFRATPLLTPPEDAGEIKWNALSFDDLPSTQHLQPTSKPFVSHAVTTISNEDSNEQSQEQAHPPPNQPTQHSRISLPSITDMDGHQGGNGQAWLDRALEHTVSTISTSAPQSQYIQMVAQLLPLRMNGASSAKPVFESILETIQTKVTTTEPPYITITHAVPHMIAMDEVPTSPPATPNAAHLSEDYFDMQTIFSHAAVVPTYHSIANSLTVSSARPSNPVVAPASIHVSVLERYIPPASTQEYMDFFSISSRSYLVDRLAELSADGGTLLLLYPTKTGAKTFASQYLGPILEPLLRQFVFYNNLYTDIASTLGHMGAVDGMLGFEQLKSKIRRLCNELSRRGLPRSGPRSTFTIVHSSIGEAILDGSTWRDAYIHQEQARMRKNLVDYQKMGGRMPEPVGHREITHGMLVRQVTDGLKASREGAGGKAVELGVFVIRRTAA